MAEWESLPTNYTDAVWTGLKKYKQISNSDGTVSFEDQTVYSNKENSFFGAKEANQMNQAINRFATMVADGAGPHNASYRGANLGTAVTAEQYSAISSGEFTDLYIGDYWTISGVVYRIAAFDYYYNMGTDGAIISKHHAVIVPDDTIGTSFRMMATASTSKGYKGTEMWSTNLTDARHTVKDAFSGHVIKHKEFLTNAVANGLSTAGAWYDCEAELMSEMMVYGCNVLAPTSNGSTIPNNYMMETSQLPLFRFNRSLICNRKRYWLRDVLSNTQFSSVMGSGNVAPGVATGVYGIRPFFLIG